jgi:acetyl-CoA synthetase
MNEDLNGIEALSYEKRRFVPSPEFVSRALVTDQSLFDEADLDHEGFWERQARELLDWDHPWSKVCEWDLPYSEWFVDGKINVSYNCLDRHVLAGEATRSRSTGKANLVIHEKSRMPNF